MARADRDHQDGARGERGVDAPDGAALAGPVDAAEEHDHRPSRTHRTSPAGWRDTVAAVARPPRIELHPATPWALRLFDRSPLSDFWTGAAIGLAVQALFLVYSAAFGEGIGRLGMVAGSGPFWVAELIQDLFLGLTLAVSAASIRGARRDFDGVLPWLEASEHDRGSLERQILTYRRAPLLAVGLVVGIAAALLTVTESSLWVEDRMPGWTHPAVLWIGFRNLANWWVASRAMALELMLGHAFSQLGDRLASVDLLDRSPLAPFGRRALRNVLLWMLLAAFLSLTYLGEGWASELMPLALVALGCFTLAAFLLPLSGAHRRIRDLKRAELERVRAAIREARDHALARSAEEPATGGRLSDLVTYEARIAAVGEWPIDASTLLRFGLYLAIGFGSWIGAALVERALNTAMR